MSTGGSGREEQRLLFPFWCFVYHQCPGKVSFNWYITWDAWVKLMGNGLLVSHVALLFHSVEGSGKNHKYAELRHFCHGTIFVIELRTVHSNDWEKPKVLPSIFEVSNPDSFPFNRLECLRVKIEKKKTG